jgi:2-iminobutanoate/2-iminopropanoate deaminase
LYFYILAVPTIYQSFYRKGEKVKEVIQTDQAPGAIGPYSQAIKIPPGKSLIFCSGTIPLDISTGEIVTKPEGDSREMITIQSELALRHLQAVLKEAGATLQDVVDVTVFLSFMSHFGEMNEVYKQFFKTDCPARAAFEVGGLPKDALVEFKAIAAI